MPVTDATLLKHSGRLLRLRLILVLGLLFNLALVVRIPLAQALNRGGDTAGNVASQSGPAATDSSFQQASATSASSQATETPAANNSLSTDANQTTEFPTTPTNPVAGDRTNSTSGDSATTFPPIQADPNGRPANDSKAGWWLSTRSFSWGLPGQVARQVVIETALRNPESWLEVGKLASDSFAESATRAFDYLIDESLPAGNLASSGAEHPASGSPTVAQSAVPRTGQVAYGESTTENPQTPEAAAATPSQPALRTPQDVASTKEPTVTSAGEPADNSIATQTPPQLSSPGRGKVPTPQADKQAKPVEIQRLPAIDSDVIADVTPLDSKQGQPVQPVDLGQPELPTPQTQPSAEVPQPRIAAAPFPADDSFQPSLLLSNPLSNRGAIHFRVNGEIVTLQAGQSRRFPVHAAGWELEFHRGADFGVFSQHLDGGVFRFQVGPQGWELRTIKYAVR